VISLAARTIISERRQGRARASLRSPVRVTTFPGTGFYHTSLGGDRGYAIVAAHENTPQGFYTLRGSLLALRGFLGTAPVGDGLLNGISQVGQARPCPHDGGRFLDLLQGAVVVFP
jgi:hypothetical protein